MNVEFEEENYKHNDVDQVKTGSAVGNWLVKSGFAKDASSANIIMISGAVFIFGISAYFFVYGFNLPTFGTAPDTNVQLPPEFRNKN